MDTILYAITGIITAILVAVPVLAVCYTAEWLYKNNKSVKQFFDKII